MVLDSDAHGDFSAFLTDDIFVKESLNFSREHVCGGRKWTFLSGFGFGSFLGHDFFAEGDAIIADADAVIGGVFSVDEATNIFFFFAAEGAANCFLSHLGKDPL